MYSYDFSNPKKDPQDCATLSIVVYVDEAAHCYISYTNYTSHANLRGLSESERMLFKGYAKIARSAAIEMAKQLINEMQLGRVIEQGKIFKVKGIGK